MIHIEKRKYDWLLTTEQFFPNPIEEVFDFFGDAGNLEDITPPWLKFHVVTPQPILMQAGTLIDYTLRLHMIPIKWKTEIAVWERPYRFVDRQLKGPYKKWHHTHTFTKVDGGTQVCDHVEYDVPGGRLANWLLVENDVRRIFQYRFDAMQRIFIVPSSSKPALNL